ncbi:hypothetical protein EsH8_VI_000424 [Colletotrichum jinshuiense]
MGKNASDIFERHQTAAKAFGNDPLLILPNGTVVDLARGYIPLLTRFTFEDKAAKGLRKRKAGEKPENPIYFSALELLRNNPILLLTGLSGSGKTTFGKHLCFRLATTGFGNAQPLIRNDFGDTREEIWDAGDTVPCYFTVDSQESLRSLVEVTIPDLLESASASGMSLVIVLDTIQRAGDTGLPLLSQGISLIKGFKNVKLLLLGETGSCERWPFPPDVIRHELLPLLGAHRRGLVSKFLDYQDSKVVVGTGVAAANPSLFALALQARHHGGQAEELLDAWLLGTIAQADTAEILCQKAFDRISDNKSPEAPSGIVQSSPVSNPALYCDAIQRLLAARHLACLSFDAAIELFHRQPQASRPIINSCLIRLKSSAKSDGLIEKLLSGSSSEAQRGALLVADFVAQNDKFRDRIKYLALEIVVQGSLSANDREKAGRILSIIGDPRDLTALAEVPAGRFVMGSESHPNSLPVQTISLNKFRIGLYPVVNRDYSVFARETGRDWLSQDGTDPERSNAPATDLTWHDARAYCSYLTTRWRASGKIGYHEEVRLPTEPEWERAARGDQNDTGSDGLVFPWGTTWQDESANSEEAGFNTTCAVGIFPQGRSPYGCFDMAGHVWEWCTTLWGEDMATPSFRYPWQIDGREALDAPEKIRRVLRGGCFSSPKIKANCTYRGSLEPSGFWRGNGFRVVVAAKD